MRIFLIIFLLINFSAKAQDGCSDVNSYLLFDAKNRYILSEKYSDKISYPASLTKLMTLYLTFEALEKKQINLSDEIIISQRAAEASNINKITTLKLKEGDKITIEQAINAVIVKSMNGAAVALAEKVAENEWNFVRKMNEKAFVLRMYNTSFRNATGLHEDGQYTTAHDLARLVIALRLDFLQFYPLFALKEFQYGDKKFITHNNVLLEYEGAEGLKTGFTSVAGYNLISAASKENERVISILMGCKTIEARDIFTKELLDKAFANIKNENILSRVEIAFDYDEKSKEKTRNYQEEMHFGMNFESDF
jgi:D-alanyl-D-alanine carboxypeptidase